jgi:hypothetical protein
MTCLPSDDAWNENDLLGRLVELIDAYGGLPGLDFERGRTLRALFREDVLGLAHGRYGLWIPDFHLAHIPREAVIAAAGHHS